MVEFGVLAVSFALNFAMGFFILCSVLLILLVLIQKGKGGGLGAAFGGGGAGGLMGTKTGDFLTWLTIVLAAVFLIMAVVLAKFYKPSVGRYGQQETPVSRQAPLRRSGQVPPGQEIPAGQRAPAAEEDTAPDVNSTAGANVIGP